VRIEKRITVFGQPSRWSIATGSGRPLLLVNGLGGNIEMWNPFRDAIGSRTTIAFDAPGSGASRAPLGQPSIAYVADAIAEALDKLGIDQPDVLGYSFGGAVAQEFARRHPTRVHRLILAATTPGWGAPMPSPMALANLMTPARYYSDPISDSLSLAAFGEAEGTAKFDRLHGARRKRPPTLYGYWWQLMAISQWSSSHWLGTINVPTLVVTGANDQVAGPATARMLASAIPKARLLVVPEAGHLLLYSDQPHPIVPEILRFLDDTDGESVGQDVRELAST
jgi:pimeloyl-ACP methyl ester carboxylesterase